LRNPPISPARNRLLAFATQFQKSLESHGLRIPRQWRTSGEIISLTADEARELAPPFGDVVSPVNSERGSSDAGFNGSKRRKRQVSN
jgi:hypothetical protein